MGGASVETLQLPGTDRHQIQMTPFPEEGREGVKEGEREGD